MARWKANMNAEERAEWKAEMAEFEAKEAKLTAEYHAKLEAEIAAEIEELGGPLNAVREYKRRVCELEREIPAKREKGEDWCPDWAKAILLFFGFIALAVGFTLILDEFWPEGWDKTEQAAGFGLATAFVYILRPDLFK